MISTLNDLMAPTTESEFRDMLRAKALIFRSGEGMNRFNSLMTEEALLRLIESGALAPDELRITRREEAIPPLLYQEKGKPSFTKIRGLLDRGASLVVVRLDPHVPSLDALCRDIRRHIPEEIWAGAILTNGPGGALKLHHDCEDLIILQLAGSKRWMVFDHAVVNPVKGMPEPSTPPGQPLFDRELHGGDMLFLPAGHRHRCENSSGRSLHLGIFFKPPTAWHAVSALAQQLLAEKAFRAPLTRHASPAEAIAHEARIKAELIERIAHAPFRDLFANKQDD